MLLERYFENLPFGEGIVISQGQGAILSIRNVAQRFLFLLTLSGWFGWIAVMAFRFYVGAHSSSTSDPTSGRIVVDSDKGVKFFVHQWEYTTIHWGMPTAFAVLVVGMGISMLFFRDEYKRQIRHPLTIVASVLWIGAAVWVVHTYGK